MSSENEYWFDITVTGEPEAYNESFLKDTIVRYLPHGVTILQFTPTTVSKTVIEQHLGKEYVESVESVIDIVQEKCPKHTVRVNGFVRGPNHYSYVMERLRHLSNEEKMAVSQWIGKGRKEPTIPQVVALHEALQEMLKQGFRYTDMHSGNILKDAEGNLKFIDVESWADVRGDKI